MSDIEDNLDVNVEKMMYCTLCYHDLNHHAYEILPHPLLEVVLCVECHENIQEEISALVGETSTLIDEADIQSFPEYNDICTWCFEGGDLFVCDECGHCHCRDCLTNNLGESYVDELDQSETFLCLECDETPILNHLLAMNEAQDRSIYNDDAVLKLANSLENGIESSRKDYIIDGIDVYCDVLRLRITLQEIEMSTLMLESEAIETKRTEVLEEVKSAGLDSIVQENRVTEEMNTYKSFWEKHISLLQHQECTLHEYLNAKGFNVRSLPEIDIPSLEAASPPDIIFPGRFDSQSSIINIDIDQGDPMDTIYHDNLVDELLADKFIQRYERYDDVDHKLFPKEFLQRIPIQLIKALFYAW